MKSSDDGKEVTPVPIPNTAVKLFSADGTWGEAPWESRSSLVSLFILAWPLGQAVKTPPFHGGNGGSIPPGVTI